MTSGSAVQSLDSCRCVAATGDRCGEGAAWCAEEQSVYWTDINRFLIHRLHVPDGSVTTWYFDEPVTAIVCTDRPQTLLVVFGSKICLWSPRDNRIVRDLYRLEEWPAMRFNDARADVRGSLWVGTMTNNVASDGSHREVSGTDGVLYRIDPNGRAQIWKEGIGISNTIVWSPDHKQFYFADTLANCIYSYSYDETQGSISEERQLLCFDRGVPDGSAIDAEGFIWNCRYQGQCIIRIAPNGEVAEVHELPFLKPTTCCFGGQDLSTLYVTSASSQDRLAGCLFALDTKARGIQEPRFRAVGAD